MTQMLYIMRCGTAFKFGISNNPPKRVKQLQTGNAEPIDLIFQLVLDQGIAASDVEKILHKFLKKYRKCGEWFELSEDQVFTLAQTCLRVGQCK